MSSDNVCTFADIEVGDFFILSNTINEVALLKTTSKYAFPLDTVHFKDNRGTLKAYNTCLLSSSTQVQKLQSL